MEKIQKNTDNPVQKPTFWKKAWSSFGGAALAAFAAQMPFMLTELFVIILPRIKIKKPLGEEGIAFSNKMNEMMHKVAAPAAIFGGTLGWNSPEHDYIKDKNSRLQTENAELKAMSASSNDTQKSWAESEKGKSEPGAGFEQRR